MGKPTGFMEISRQDRRYRPASDRIQHYSEFVIPLTDAEVSKQGARCMDCGIPYCHNGCPINNIIPDWNDLVYHEAWQEALQVLHSTNNFPEFTGRICPAPCEAACTLNLDDSPVTIKTIECSIVDKAWQNGWIEPQVATHRTGKRVAVVGSGPAGLAAAQQLARAGHFVTVYEKQDRIGGLLRYGIPDFKMEKSLIDRRMAQMQAEGVEFRTNSHVGGNVSVQQLRDTCDAIVLAGGSEQPRDLPVPGRELNGVHFAMDFLTASKTSASPVTAFPKRKVSPRVTSMLSSSAVAIPVPTASALPCVMARCQSPNWNYCPSRQRKNIKPPLGRYGLTNCGLRLLMKKVASACGASPPNALSASTAFSPAPKSLMSNGQKTLTDAGKWQKSRVPSVP